MTVKTRVTKSQTAAAAKSVIDNAKNPAKPQSETLASRTEAAYRRFTEAADDLLAEMGTVSWRRQFAAFACAIAIGAGAGALGSAIMSMAVVMATPLYVQFVVFVLSFSILLYGASKAAGYVCGAIIDGRIDRAMSRGVTRVRGWFNFRTVKAA